MREVILWGGTGQARVLNEGLFGSDNEIVAVFDNANVAVPFPMFRSSVPVRWCCPG